MCMDLNVPKSWYDYERRRSWGLRISWPLGILQRASKSKHMVFEHFRLHRKCSYCDRESISRNSGQQSSTRQRHIKSTARAQPRQWLRCRRVYGIMSIIISVIKTNDQCHDTKFSCVSTFILIIVSLWWRTCNTRQQLALTKTFITYFTARG